MDVIMSDETIIGETVEIVDGCYERVTFINCLLVRPENRGVFHMLECEFDGCRYAGWWPTAMLSKRTHAGVNVYEEMTFYPLTDPARITNA